MAKHPIEVWYEHRDVFLTWGDSQDFASEKAWYGRDGMRSHSQRMYSLHDFVLFYIGLLDLYQSDIARWEKESDSAYLIVAFTKKCAIYTRVLCYLIREHGSLLDDLHRSAKERIYEWYERQEQQGEEQ